jgi:hypothetical protein
MWAFLSSRFRRWLLLAVVVPGILLALKVLRTQLERRFGPSTATRVIRRIERVGGRITGIGTAPSDRPEPAAARGVRILPTRRG